MGKRKVKVDVCKLFKRMKQHFQLVSKMLKTSLGSLFKGTFGVVSVIYHKNELNCKIWKAALMEPYFW